MAIARVSSADNCGMWRFGSSSLTSERCQALDANVSGHYRRFFVSQISLFFHSNAAQIS